MVRSKFPTRLVTAIILALIFGVALWFRVYPFHDAVFSGEWIKFTGIDAYYHMRLVDNLLEHFPRYITFDPYTSFPHGHMVGWPPFYDWLLAGVIMLVGWGSPTERIVDTVAVYFPTVLGAITIVPVYFIGKEIFNRWVGLLAAALIAILPGEFLHRSMLGFTDHHVAEALLVTVTSLFLILAIKSARQRRFTFNHLKSGGWGIIGRPLAYSLLAGISLALYVLGWVGSLLFVFVLFVYFVIQFLIDHFRGENTDYLVVTSVLPVLTALIINLPLLSRPSWVSRLYLPTFIIAVLTPLLLNGVSCLLRRRGIKPVYYPLILVGLGVSALAIFYAINPSLLKSMLGMFGIFAGSGLSITIAEVEPILFPGGSFSLARAWLNFTTGLYLSLVALGILIYLVIKQGSADKNLLVVWSLLMLAATLGQSRFSYYLAVNVALLTAYISWRILAYTGVKNLGRPITVSRMVKTGKKKRKKSAKTVRITSRHIVAALGVVVVFFLVVFPNINLAVAKQPRYAPTDSWCEALTWLGENSPEPFGDPYAYYEFYEPPPRGTDYHYPESAYGIMSWWDYGHWITRIAHRIPNSNPFQSGANEAARFFTARDEAAANEMMDRLGSKYVIIDYETATIKFPAVTLWAGSTPEDFSDTYYQRQGDRLVKKQFFYPEYYQSMAARLYNFEGSAVTATNPLVISFEHRITREGKPWKEITSSQSFFSYEEAKTFIANQDADNYRIVGTNRFISPVPLDALGQYRLVYSSEASTIQEVIKVAPSIKIFEYIK